MMVETDLIWQVTRTREPPRYRSGSACLAAAFLNKSEASPEDFAAPDMTAPPIVRAMMMIMTVEIGPTD